MQMVHNKTISLDDPTICPPNSTSDGDSDSDSDSDYDDGDDADEEDDDDDEFGDGSDLELEATAGDIPKTPTRLVPQAANKAASRATSQTVPRAAPQAAPQAIGQAAPTSIPQVVTQTTVAAAPVARAPQALPQGWRLRPSPQALRPRPVQYTPIQYTTEAYSFSQSASTNTVARQPMRPPRPTNRNAHQRVFAIDPRLEHRVEVARDPTLDPYPERFLEPRSGEVPSRYTTAATQLRLREERQRQQPPARPSNPVTTQHGDNYRPAAPNQQIINESRIIRAWIRDNYLPVPVAGMQGGQGQIYRRNAAYPNPATMSSQVLVREYCVLYAEIVRRAFLGRAPGQPRRAP
ncbi:hypothetical protein EKO27_g10137 [Xylaria grammica]|uniref:Uncharacterized protein n=1 Tax=Xylaria grammica TaxID=363999 RepID=A0A439CS59_9PEZI|nr:hypothetical protein EKO27_g10137 [Xylaria grammica]